jgi:hypothetical protein
LSLVLAQQKFRDLAKQQLAISNGTIGTKYALLWNYEYLGRVLLVLSFCKTRRRNKTARTTFETTQKKVPGPVEIQDRVGMRERELSAAAR